MQIRILTTFYTQQDSLLLFVLFFICRPLSSFLLHTIFKYNVKKLFIITYLSYICYYLFIFYVYFSFI